MKTVLWIVGEPGIGKTTLARGLLQLHGRQEVISDSPKWTKFGESACSPGYWKGGKFDGSDTLPISQIKPAVEFLRSSMNHDLCVIDGDKLSTEAAVQAVVESGSRALCLRLFGEQEAAERRVARGTTQNPTWVKGRRTKSGNFWDKFIGKKIMLPADTDPDSLIRVTNNWVFG